MAVTDIVCEWPGPVFYHLMTVVRVQPLAWSVENVPSYQLLTRILMNCLIMAMTLRIEGK